MNDEANVVYTSADTAVDTIIVSEKETEPTILDHGEGEITIIQSIEIGPRGIRGRPGEGWPGYEVNFSWGDASPTPIYEMDESMILRTVEIIVLEEFDGEGAALSIGTDSDPELFMKKSDNDPKSAGIYSVSPGFQFSSYEEIKVFITPGAAATKGNGKIILEY
jgi:hypothetical protein